MSNLREVSKTVVLGITVDQDTAELVRARAREGDRSVSAELRRALIKSGYFTRPDDQDHGPAAA